MDSASDSNNERRIGYEHGESRSFGYEANGAGIASSNLGDSFVMLNTGETANPAFHASWSNSSAGDFLGATSRAHESAHLAVERPDSIARATSTPASRSVSIGEHNGVSSIIHDAARITNWRTVKSLCETNPEAAKYAGRDGWTALHHACNRRCPDADVAEALIRAYPDALLEEEEKGWTPLHYACRFKTATDVVRLLLHLYPEKGHVAVSRSDRQGRTPLYYAVRYDAPPGVVGLLLEVDASAVLEEDQNADSPLALVWDAWAEKLDGKRTLQKLHVSDMEAEGMTPQEQAARVYERLKRQSKLLEKWNKVNMFLKAAFGFPVTEETTLNENNNNNEEKKDSRRSQDRKWRMLHATAGIKCHPSLFLLAHALHPEQAFELDENDLKGPIHISGGFGAASQLTALHLAASSRANGEAGRLVISQLLTANPDAAHATATDGSLPLHRIVQNKHRPHWTFDGAKDLYVANTRAVQTPELNGQLPLHRAAEAIIHHEEAPAASFEARSIICNLLAAHSDAAAHADNKGCLPLHLIAQNAEYWDDEVQELYDACPAAARIRAGVVLGNRLPLHMAAANPNAHHSLIRKLVEMNPRGASQSDRQGKLPLHLACEAGLTWNAVTFIHEAFPEAVQQIEQNPRRWNALQMAAACLTAEEDLIFNLAKLHPDAAGMADTRGRYALHLACLSGKTWEGGLCSLFEANPEALRCADEVGLLPFFISSFRYCASPGDKLKRPKTFDISSRRVSRSASIESEQRSAKDMEDAKTIEVLFQLLKADPTVLGYL
jgi:ankyrin repeat protein